MPCLRRDFSLTENCDTKIQSGVNITLEKLCGVSDTDDLCLRSFEVKILVRLFVS